MYIYISILNCVFKYKNRYRQEHDFSKHNSRSVDEIWYKRAVEQHFVEPKSFVFSVPFNGNPSANQNTLVTASHAIFHTEDKKSAPVAVVGYQFQFSALYSLFKNTTSKVSSLLDPEIYINIFHEYCLHHISVAVRVASVRASRWMGKCRSRWSVSCWTTMAM